MVFLYGPPGLCPGCGNSLVILCRCMYCIDCSIHEQCGAELTYLPTVHDLIIPRYDNSIPDYDDDLTQL
jgi:hypothetical protein